MIVAFRSISLRHFMAHKLRTLLTTGGIALGVAIVIAMRLLHESVSESYERTVAKIAGKAALQITNGQGGVPEELLDDVKQVSGVRPAAASVQGFVTLPRHPGEPLYVFGIDRLADQELRDVQVMDVFAAQRLFGAVSLVSAILAAVIPARQAVSVHPLEALRPAARRTGEATPYPRAALVGAVLIGAVTLLWSMRAVAPLPRNLNGSIMILGLLVGASLVVPSAVRSFALHIEPLLSRLLGPVGSLAGRSIVDHIGRWRSPARRFS